MTLKTGMNSPEKTGQKIGERDTIPSRENICSPAGRISRWLTDCVQ